VDLAKTDRTTLRRLPELGSYDREEAYAILDEALYCHVGFTIEGSPTVIPTIHARDGDRLIFHGSTASRLMRTLRDGTEVCIAVTLLDGLAMARSVFHHSMNYRSVLVFGRARLIEGDEERLRAMEALTERIAAGRWADARHPDRNESRATMMAEVPITEASVKTRSGPPEDEPEDLSLGVWAGIIPVVTTFGEPVPSPDLEPAVELPGYLTGYSR
jgi:nitroimidazol reductase NimA-like FMN-containing flavoprotein (pyridoxamine 5'-phosphate oxidase superfamily)